MKTALLLIGLLLGGMILPTGPAMAADAAAWWRSPAAPAEVLPFPRSNRAQAIWDGGACWDECGAYTRLEFGRLPLSRSRRAAASNIPTPPTAPASANAVCAAGPICRSTRSSRSANKARVAEGVRFKVYSRNFKYVSDFDWQTLLRIGSLKVWLFGVSGNPEITHAPVRAQPTPLGFRLWPRCEFLQRDGASGALADGAIDRVEQLEHSSPTACPDLERPVPPRHATESPGRPRLIPLRDVDVCCRQQVFDHLDAGARRPAEAAIAEFRRVPNSSDEPRSGKGCRKRKKRSDGDLAATPVKVVVSLFVQNLRPCLSFRSPVRA